MPLKRQAQRRQPSASSATEEENVVSQETSPKSAAKRKTVTPQKHVAGSLTSSLSPGTRSTRASASAAQSPEQNITMSSTRDRTARDAVEKTPGGSVYYKAKRGRPRKRASEIEPDYRSLEMSPPEADKKEMKTPENAPIQPPKKRKVVPLQKDAEDIIDKQNDSSIESVEEEEEVSPEKDKEQATEEQEQEAEVSTDAVNKDIDESAAKKAQIKSIKRPPRDIMDNQTKPSHILECPVCGAYCVQLVRHIRTKHEGVDNYETHIRESRIKEQNVQPKESSNKAFVGKSSSGQKVSKRKLVRPKNVQCPICMKVVRRYDFNKHVRNVHSGEKPNKCPHCDYSTPWKGNLTTHINGVHLKERNHDCPSCSLAFKTRGALIGHVRKVHEGLYTPKERSFECETCHKMFFKKFHLERHVRIHSGEKPFNCVFCEKRFSSKTNLDAHVQAIHLKIKPFKCGYCEKGFLRKKQLSVHIENCHVNPPVKKSRPTKLKKVRDEVTGVVLVNNEHLSTTGTAVDQTNSITLTNNAVAKGENSQTIIWRVQLPDGSQELHIRTCESDQTPQVLLIPQNHQTSADGTEEGVIVLQPIPTSSSVTLPAGSKVIPESPIRMMDTNEKEQCTLIPNIASHSTLQITESVNSESNTHVIATSENVADILGVSSGEGIASSETNQSEIVAQTSNIQNVVMQSIEGQDGIVSILSTDQIPTSHEANPVVLTTATGEIIGSGTTDTNSVSLVANGGNNSQEYFSWQPVYNNQSVQSFQTFQFDEQNSNSQTFTTPSTQGQFTYQVANQSFQPVEPAQIGDLPQNFNIHSMEKTFEITASDELCQTIVTAAGDQPAQVTTNVVTQDNSQTFY